MQLDKYTVKDSLWDTAYNYALDDAMQCGIDPDIDCDTFETMVEQIYEQMCADMEVEPYV